MQSKKLVVLCQLLLMIILCTKAVKIGISKPLPLTTTLAPNTTIEETTTEEYTTEAISSTTINTSTTPKTFTTTLKATTAESEWPEFPPKKTLKTSNKTTTTTIKPLTTTFKPSTTTIRINIVTSETNTTDNPDILPTLPTSTHQWPIKPIYCFCDLTLDTCDINCCCDHDCSAEALKVFRCQLEKPIDLEVHEGRFEDFKFQHGLPSCEINDGWLCVFRTYKPLIKEEVTHSFEDTSRYNKWPNLLLESEAVKVREFYKFGDILRIVNMKTKEIQNFDLPSSFQTAYCQIREPIYHLKPIKRSCLISSYENLQEIKLKLQQLQENFKIVRKPNIPDDLDNTQHKENYIGNITVNKCFENIKNCSTYNSSSEKKENQDLYKVKINILHNFTHIQEVAVDLWLKDNDNIKNINNTSQEYWLSYEIEFLNKTLKQFKDLNIKGTKKPTVVSGPLGYLHGKPIILARYEPFNKSQPLSIQNQVINYFNPNNSDSHTLSLFAKENGECKRLNFDKDAITFGVNVAKYCKIKLANDTVLQEESAKSNFTEICVNLQQRIHAQLFGQDLEITDLSSYLISQLGKPENNSNKWLPLKVFNIDFDSVFGQYLHESNTFICRNILLSLTYEFHMATFMVDNVPWQNVIKHAALHLAERHDLEFALDENLEVPITMTVRFYDVHEKAVSAAYVLKNFNLVYGIILFLALVLDTFNK